MSGRLRFGALLCLMACAETEPARVPAKALSHVASANTFMTEPRIRQYRLAQQWPDKQPPERAFVAGMRLTQRGDGLTTADTVATTALDNGREVPKAAGGGFVFWNRQGLYRSREFLGRLQAFASTPFAVDDVSFGPGFWLARSNEGDRVAVDAKTGARRELKPAGLVDMAAATDGRVVAVLELGRAAVSIDEGGSYREVQAELNGAVTRLSRAPLGFIVDDKVLVSLGSDGKLSRAGLLPEAERLALLNDGRLARRRAQQPKKKGAEHFSPLSEAVERGVLKSPGRALVSFEAAVTEVELSSGLVLRQGPQLLPDSPSCELLRLGSELLMQCRGQNALAILSDVDGDEPALEHRFAGTPALRVGLGQLLVEAACDGERLPLTVCLRSSGGEWKQLSKPADPPSPPGTAGTGGAPAIPASPPSALAYVSRMDGGAVALVREPARGYIDLLSGRQVPLTGDFDEMARDPSHCLVDTAGTLRCLTSSGPIAFDRDGKQEPRVFRFKWASAIGLRGLGRDNTGQFFQTEDLGRTWVEVEAPPAFSEAYSNRDRCSDVGCLLGGWLRTGWEALPPKPLDPPESIELPALDEPALPLLSCRSLAAPTVQFQNPLTSDGATEATDDTKQLVAGFGLQQVRADHFQIAIETPAPAQSGSGSSVATRGLLTGFSREDQDPAAPEAKLVSMEPLRFRFVEHFAAAARPGTASVTFAELARAARRVGGASVSTDFASLGSLFVQPVLAETPSKTAGFVAALELSRVYVNAGRATALTPTPDTWTLDSAAQEHDGALLLLFTDEDGTARVWRYRQGVGVELFGAPATWLRQHYPTPNALGVSALGIPAILRFPSGDRAPTKDDPVLAYAPQAPIEELAAWSSLRLASDPACADKAGYHAIVLPPQSWLGLRHGATTVTDDWGMIAEVRWSRERVCLEALELSDSPFSHSDEETETRVVLSQLPKQTAARIGFSPGFELREPLSCELASAR